MGEEVICVDNFYCSSKRNVERLMDYYDFELIRHDVTFPLYLEVDQIYHLACPASPIHYQRDPVQTIKTNVHGMINVLGLAKRTGARILQASTSEVYGDPEVHPQPESYVGHVNPIGPRACYDEGKRCAETLCFSYAQQYDVDVRVARIFNTYGPGMAVNDGRVMSNLIVQAIRNEPLTIYGDGEQTRSFCFVDDTVRGLIKLMHGNHRGPVNIGNPTEHTINEIAAMIDAMISGDENGTERDWRSLPVDDPKQRQPNIGVAERVLNWRPRHQLRDGLRTTIDYFMTELNQ